jgi:hypothetical protein
MSLQIKINGKCEAMVRTQLAEGHAGSPEELIERALEAYSVNTSRQFSLGRSRKTAAEAVADIRELGKTIDLAGLKVKDLVHEGHKY